ncbi:MAG: sulfatase [Verrucomicrobiales bacterium]|nr:sulfatase [Verrucomicrobiales bacterium]
MKNRLTFWPATLWIAVTTLTIASAADRQPNIIVLFADDLGYGELSCQGNPEIPTPHIDSIANNGVRFTSGYVAGPNCSPSRAGLLTGRIPTRFGYEFNPTGALNEEPGFGLPPREITIAEALHDGGYNTGLIGKWHQGGTAKYHPFRHGFDEFFGFTHEGHYFVPPPYDGVTTLLRRKTLPGGVKGRWIGKKNLHYHDILGNEPDYDANNPIVRGGQPVEESEYLTDALTREAVDFIDRHDDKPFFLYLAYNAVHSPLQGADAYMEKFAHIEDIHRRIFASMLANMDDSVGGVMEQLRKSGLEENTIVFFLSDNGGPTVELTSSNLPLRGSKGQMYEGAIRVPFMMQWKGEIPAGQVYDKPVSSFDIFATAAANSAGVTAPKQVEGVDLIPYLTGKNDGAPHETLFWRQGGKTALRHGDWKLVRMGKRLVAGKANWELYDLSKDISEENNLAKSNPERLAELVEIWEKMNGEMSEPLF